MILHDETAINWRLVRYALPLGRAASDDPNINRWRLYFSDEHYLDVTAHGDPDDELAGEHVVPAAPGYFVVEPVYSGEGPDEPKEMQQMPVIAWRVFNEQVRPVILDHIATIYGVLQPDGTVMEIESGLHFETTAVWMEDIRTREAQRRKAK